MTNLDKKLIRQNCTQINIDILESFERNVSIHVNIFDFGIFHKKQET